MNDWLQHPAVQAGFAPFGVALPLALLLVRTRFLAVAGVSGLVVLLVLTIGFSLEPLTSVRKAIVVTFGATAIAFALEMAPRRSASAAAITAVVALSVIWVLQRIIEQQAPAMAWLLAASASLYVLLIVGGTLALGGNSLRTAVIGAALGWGSGVIAILGASALLGQIGIALGTASAAAALAQMLRGHVAPLGWTLGIPAAVGASFAGLLASATGELRWYALLPLLLVAPAVRLVPELAKRPWQQALLCGLAALVPLGIAVALARITPASPT